MVLGEGLLELDQPVLESPADVPGLPPPVRALFEWLGFRYLRLRYVEDAEAHDTGPSIDGASLDRDAAAA